jgi:hypothetical protein
MHSAATLTQIAAIPFPSKRAVDILLRIQKSEGWQAVSLKL